VKFKFLAHVPGIAFGSGCARLNMFLQELYWRSLECSYILRLSSLFRVVTHKINPQRRAVYRKHYFFLINHTLFHDWKQSRRQKVFNGGLYVSSGGLDIQIWQKFH